MSNKKPTLYRSSPAIDQQYVDLVRTLFTPSSAPAVERSLSERGRAEILAQAELLAPVSEQLTALFTNDLSAPDSSIRIQASTRILAKAVTDLEVSELLLRAAQNEHVGPLVEQPSDPAAQPRIERSGVAGADLDEYFQAILGDFATVAPVERGTVAMDLPSAREELANTVAGALVRIRDRAATSGQNALKGFLGLGMVSLAEAAGVLGMDLATAWGQEKIASRVYELGREFAIKTYDALLALLGKSAVQVVSQQVVDWVGKLSDGKLFGELLERLYETTPTAKRLRQLVEGKTAEQSTYETAAKAVNALVTHYEKQTKYADRVCVGLRWVAVLPPASVPPAQVLLGATYLVLGGYVILSGAEFVDAPRIQGLYDTAGVGRIVEAALAVDRAPSGAAVGK